MTVDNELFSEFGLTGNEGKILEALMNLGSSTGTAIASKLGINKSVAYFVLDQLVQKGFASFVVINKKREYRSLDPIMLNMKLEERKKEFLKKYGDISSILSQVTQKKKKQALVNIFNGWDGIRTAFNDILISTKSGEDYYVFSINLPETVLPRFRRFIRKFQEQRAAKGIICSILVDQKLKDTIGADRRKEAHTSIRFVTEEVSMPMTVNVYANKVLLAVWGEEPLTIIIESKDVADSFKSFFRLLWNGAKKA